MKFFLCRENGFGLIEAMVAMTLLAIGLLAVASGEVYSIMLNQRSRETAQAVSVAQSMIELIRRNSVNLNNYADFKETATYGMTTMHEADFNYFKSGLAGVSTATTTDGFSCGTRTATSTCGWIVVGDSSPFPSAAMDARVVTVNVAWPGKRGGIQLSTILSP